jgi:hypothetical protein
MFTPASQHSAALPSGSTSGSAPSSPTPSPSPTPKVCARNAPGFPCTMRNRIKAIRGYMRHLPGSIGIVIYNRKNGAIWHNANAGVSYPAASTMKLAMMTDILQRSDAGSINLTSADRQAMFEALYTSNDDDANYLWNKYEDGSFLNRIRAFGMNDANFTSSYINWGFMDCTAQDLNNLINYVLKDAPANVRNYLVYRLQHVAALDQQWGVWGAGPENHPGNKDGWEQDGNIWITNTVGFAGPDQQYTMAIMYNLEGFRGVGDAGFKFGSNKLTQIASILFQGRHTTAPTPQASAVP